MNKLFDEIVQIACIETSLFLQSQDDWKYSFIPNNDYLKLNFEEQMRAYWLEMLKRSALVSLLSLCKLNHWKVAIERNIEINNYYSFCATLRGFVESCADSIFTLKKIPLTISKDFCAIKHSFHQFQGVVLTHDILEKELIHYLQAKRLSKEEIKLLPNIYQAKHISEYVESIDGMTDDVKRLYSYLCGITHPGAESNNIFLFDCEGQLIVCNDSSSFEKELIAVLISETGEMLNKLYKRVSFLAFENLELINMFEIAELEYDIPTRLSVADSLGWKRIQLLTEKSNLIYENALMNGVYR